MRDSYYNKLTFLVKIKLVKVYQQFSDKSRCKDLNHFSSWPKIRGIILFGPGTHCTTTSGYHFNRITESLKLLELEDNHLKGETFLISINISHHQICFAWIWLWFLLHYPINGVLKGKTIVPLHAMGMIKMKNTRQHLVNLKCFIWFHVHAINIATWRVVFKLAALFPQFLLFTVYISNYVH